MQVLSKPQPQPQHKKREQQEDQDRLNKAKQNKVSIYTYDYNGSLLPVSKIKVQKLPPSSYHINYDYKDEKVDLGKKKTKSNVKLNDLSSRNKKPTETAQQYAQQVQISQNPISEAMTLVEGVTMTIDGIRKTNPRPSTIDFGQLTISDGGRLRLQKKQFDEIIQKQTSFIPSKKSEDTDKNRVFMSTAPLKLMNNNQSEKQFRSIDTMYLMNFGGSKTPYDKTQGDIKIEHHRMFQTMTLTQTIPEEEEIMMKTMDKNKASAELAMKKSPIDEFNSKNVLYNREWGKQNQILGQTLNNYAFGENKPSQKSLRSTLGYINKPREKHFIKTPEATGAFDLRGTTSDGIRNLNLLSRGQTRDSNTRPILSRGGFTSENLRQKNIQSGQGFRKKIIV